MEAPLTRRAPTQKLTADTAEKDDVELRLERALFGDDAGFLASLTQYDPDGRALIPLRDDEADRPGDEEDGDEDEGDSDDLEDIADDQLFFLDAGAAAAPSTRPSHSELSQPHSHLPQREEETVKKAAWYDPDDDLISVSLAAHTRLRKLRDTEDDDVVSGREYIARLRRQYERLHPTPEWVKYARKKRRVSRGDEDDEMDQERDSDSDVSMADDGSLAVTPLADLLRTSGGLTNDDAQPSSRRNRKLRPEVIDIQRLKDVSGPGPSSVDVLQFHPTYPLLLSGGPSSTATLHHISPNPPNPNPVLTSLHLKGTPLHSAAFCTAPSAAPGDNTRILLSSRRRYLHTWSLTNGVVSKTTRPIYGDGRHEQRTTEAFKISPDSQYLGLVSSAKKGGGTINILRTETMQWICACRVDSRGGIADFDFWGDSAGISVAGKNGEVSEYDITERRVVARWADDGGVGITTLALSAVSPGAKTSLVGGSRYIALGSSSGIVNIYDRQTFGFLSASSDETSSSQGGSAILRPTPLRALDHLTTPVSQLAFSPQADLLVMSSRWKKNALKLVHLPSATVYRNWPTDRTPLGRISSVALSADGGYLAVGNEQGKIRLWEVRA